MNMHVNIENEYARCLFARLSNVNAKIFREVVRFAPDRARLLCRRKKFCLRSRTSWCPQEFA